MPTSHRQRRTISISQSILTPSAAKTSAAPDFDEKARLPCFATGTPQPATTSALAGEMLKLPEASPPVPTVSIVPGGASIASALARIVRAAPETWRPLYQPRQSEGNRGRRCCPFVCRDVPQPAQRRFDVGLSRMGADLRDPGLHRRGSPPGLEHRPGATGRPV